MSHDKQPADSMHAARLQSTQSVCRYYKYSGTCRYKQKQCKQQHIYQALPEGNSNLPLVGERHWCLSSSSVSSEDECLVEAEPWRFSLLSYNILADKYAKHYRSYLYDNVPSTYLDWHHRRTAIIAELAHLQPDIICLQEVDRYEDLEAELEQLGYAGIYLQRDGGRRDGCATFWRTSLLKPALVRQLRYSQYDLKDNVALLVLFEPHSQEDAAMQAAGTAGHGALEQQQVQPEMTGNLQLQQQELQEQQGQQQRKQDLLSQWLPRSWRSSSSSSSHRHQKTHLKPAPGFHGSSGGSALYQLPSEVLAHQSRSWAGHVSNSVSNNNVVGSTTHAHRKGGSNSGRFGRIRSSKGSKAAVAAAATAESENNSVDGGMCPAAEQLQLAPEWHRCGLLVANTHIIFTPDKGEVKLGQARMLIQEAAQMAEWYLQQQQRAAAAAAGGAGSSKQKSSSSSSSSRSLAASVPRGVATIIAGDFNATPNSPMYTFLSKGRIDLHKVNKRNVSHMCSGSSAKGYRGFRRTQKRKSIDEQRRSLEEQRRSLEQQQRDAAASSATGQPGISSTTDSTSRQPEFATARAPNGVSSGAMGSNSAVTASAGATEAGGSGVANGGSCSFDANSPRSNSSSSFYVSPPSPVKSTSSTVGASSSTAAGSTPMYSSTADGSKQYRWSDKEVRRAAGMSFDELVEASIDAAVAEVAAASGSKFELGSSRVNSTAGSKPHSPTTKIARAAVAFGAHVAAGAGAAAASVAAAAAAESHEPLESVTGTAAAAAVASAVSSGEQPLLLRHDLQLKSCYESVLGCEPDYTSSHSLFMDTCDYVWYTETPLTAPAQTQQQQMQDSSSGSSAQPLANNGVVGSYVSSSSHAGKQGLIDEAQQQDSGRLSSGSGYELKPVAVLLPPDGMRLNKGLPSRWFGSDHIALVADFELSLNELNQDF